MGDIENPAFDEEVHKDIEETDFNEYVENNKKTSSIQIIKY